MPDGTRSSPGFSQAPKLYTKLRRLGLIIGGQYFSPPTPSNEHSSPTIVIPHTPARPGLTSRNSSTSLASPVDSRQSTRSLNSPQKRSSSANRTLFNFDDISKYVIPHSALCGRLVICSTEKHRIIGFPVQLMGKYKRNYFRYNLCFVFERAADLSCYEPIVRKVSRVLTSCEEESGFLSNPQTSPALHAILEQLYEDLNSYSETSITIDRFNSIELKIFPFYPNPPEVKDWMVPLALINLSKRIEDNWDLTMAKVCKFIDGINHVSRIAHLADCHIALTRQAISHLLYYQVIMTIDIFQYSNMYTLRKSIQRLAEETHVMAECGPYVTRPGNAIPDWPRLLHLYSRLKAGKTVWEWMEAYNVHELGIDVRRFTSFGVIKGFLRRVHRWPILLPPDPSQSTLQANVLPASFEQVSSLARKRGKSLTGAPLGFPTYTPPLPPIDIPPHQVPGLLRGRSPQILPTGPSVSPDLALNTPPTPQQDPRPTSSVLRARRTSAAEKVLEQLRSRDIQKSGHHGVAAPSPRTSWMNFPLKEDNSRTPTTNLTPLPSIVHDSPTRHPIRHGTESRRHSLISPANPPPSPVISKVTLGTARPRPSRSPSMPNVALNGLQTINTPFPMDMLAMLDGEHHTDELAVKFEASWPLLEQWLVAIGGGQGNGDFGKVCIIYR
ncbi:nitrogen permease regulator 2-domain-containing protein [Infundibulicybe gibba]|nr:nitrogen permease regulator 2-domain-containing protein [Infundibulicybe gibba]